MLEGADRPASIRITMLHLARIHFVMLFGPTDLDRFLRALRIAAVFQRIALQDLHCHFTAVGWIATIIAPLGSGLVNESQKITVAAIQMAETTV